MEDVTYNWTTLKMEIKLAEPLHKMLGLSPRQYWKLQHHLRRKFDREMRRQLFSWISTAPPQSIAPWNGYATGRPITEPTPSRRVSRIWGLVNLDASS